MGYRSLLTSFAWSEPMAIPMFVSPPGFQLIADLRLPHFTRVYQGLKVVVEQVVNSFDHHVSRGKICQPPRVDDKVSLPHKDRRHAQAPTLFLRSESGAFDFAGLKHSIAIREENRRSPLLHVLHGVERFRIKTVREWVVHKIVGDGLINRWGTILRIGKRKLLRLSPIISEIAGKYHL